MARKAKTEQTYRITDLVGPLKGVERTVTLASFRAELDERKVYADAIMAAMRKGDLAACTAAQEAMARRFG